MLMALNHVRKRYALELLLKKLKFSPVVLLQGARQTGKSFLVKNLLPDKIKKNYKNLDLATLKDFASKNPDTFVREVDEDHVLIIDEAQKVPELFDSIKAVVDDDRRPGKYILLGSTEFSKLSRIRESLTGRATRLLIYPMTLSETLHLPLNSSIHFVNPKPRVTRLNLIRYLKQGGMPGLFGIKNENEKINALKDWIDLTVYRDVALFKDIKVDSELIIRILTAVSVLEESTAGAISKFLKVDLRKVKTHLNILTTLFVLHKIEPFKTSTGKTSYYFCDVGFLNYFEASFEKKLKTWVLQELLAQISYCQHQLKKVYFYRTAKGSMIDFIICNKEKIETVFKLFSDEKVNTKQFEILHFFKEKNKSHFLDDSKQFVLSGTITTIKTKEILIAPWESIA
jgi:predicted AAA+ superfamily ATPase